MLRDIKKDEWAIVLDFLSHGHYGMDRSQPVAQVLGDAYFSLLEVIVRDDMTLKPEDRVYIGDGKRNEIKYIKGRIELKDLTVAARASLEEIVTKVVTANPSRFITFFNSSGQVTTRLHQLELLPGVGKKHLWAILDARKEKPFESFEDIKKRVPLLPSPEKMVIRRIMEEIEDKDKFRIFVPRMERQPRRF
ncbi:MAG: DUF655 domain-containing protein [Candidatus Aenigmarchaeota archaeon]|nr:DUF655 domain-containing protein [Candidatus Aenigmarchaeota archaeon]